MAIIIGPGISVGGGIYVNSGAGAPSPSPAPSDGIVTSGLAIHLDAGNAASYPGSGTTWTSLVNGYTGSMGTGVGYSASNGGVITFNGASTAFVNMYASAGALVGAATNNFSIEAWYQSNNNRPEIAATGVGGNGFVFGYFNTTGIAWKVTKYGLIDLQAGMIPQNTSWHQAVLTYSSTTGVRVYIDGALSGTAVNNNTNLRGGSSFSIGKGESTSYMHNGSIGIFRWYSAVLSASDVLQNFNAQKARFGISESVVPTGLQLYLDAGNASSYPGTGTAWTDLSGNGRNGTLTNGPTYSSADGGSIVFDGTNDFVQCSGSVTATAATFVAWIRRNGTQGSYDGILFSRGSSVTGMQFQSSNQLSYMWNGTVNTYNWQSGLIIPDLTWCMVAVSVTSTSATAYLCQSSGITSATNTVSHTSTILNDIKIGQEDFGGRFFTGSIAIAQLYDTALTASEITQNFQADRARFGV